MGQSVLVMVKKGVVVMQEVALRRVLSDEIHARAFHDFEGAGRFIRFVFLNEDKTVQKSSHMRRFFVFVLRLCDFEN